MPYDLLDKQIFPGLISQCVSLLIIFDKHDAVKCNWGKVVNASLIVMNMQLLVSRVGSVNRQLWLDAGLRYR